MLWPKRFNSELLEYRMLRIIPMQGKGNYAFNEKVQLLIEFLGQLSAFQPASGFGYSFIWNLKCKLQCRTITFQL